MGGWGLGVHGFVLGLHGWGVSRFGVRGFREAAVGLRIVHLPDHVAGAVTREPLL